jgi:hypothetical protein
MHKYIDFASKIHDIFFEIIHNTFFLSVGYNIDKNNLLKPL